MDVLFKRKTGFAAVLLFSVTYFIVVLPVTNHLGFMGIMSILLFPAALLFFWLASFRPGKSHIICSGVGGSIGFCLVLLLTYILLPRGLGKSTVDLGIAVMTDSIPALPRARLVFGIIYTVFACVLLFLWSLHAIKRQQ